MKTIWSKRFLLDAGERAAKAFAGIIAVAYGPPITIGVDVLHSDWQGVLIKAAWAAGASLALSIASVKASGISPASVVPPGV